MVNGSAQRTVLVAGMPRSGSTWQFNAARLILKDCGLSFWAGWIGDRDAADQARVHLVKLHDPNTAPASADLVLTTWRPLVDCLQSRIRMGWLARDREAVRAAYRAQQLIYTRWHARSDLESAYDDILQHPIDEIARIDSALARVLGLPQDPERPARIAADLTLIAPPAKSEGNGRYDPKTLLHPAHRGGSDGAAQVSASDMAAWLGDLYQDRLPPNTAS